MVLTSSHLRSNPCFYDQEPTATISAMAWPWQGNAQLWCSSHITSCAVNVFGMGSVIVLAALRFMLEMKAYRGGYEYVCLSICIFYLKLPVGCFSTLHLYLWAARCESGWGTDCPDWGFSLFTSVLSNRCWDNTSGHDCFVQNSFLFNINLSP
jgi:hypothetical protein